MWWSRSRPTGSPSVSRGFEMRRGVTPWLVGGALLFTATAVAAETGSRWRADHFLAQYAGNLGLFSAGVEREVGEHGALGLLAGYTPASAAGIEILAVGAKANYRFAPLLANDKATIGLYGGMGLFYYFGEQYSTRDYPRGYYNYPSSSWHLMPYLGIRLVGNEAAHRDITLYAEVGILDAYLMHYYNNPGYLNANDVINIGLGMSLPLRD